MVKVMRIELFPVWAGGKAGYLYNVTLDGELVLDRVRDPECDLARVLQSRGITGKVTVYDGNTGKARSIVNVEKLALLHTRDDKRQLGFEKYRETTVFGAPAAETESWVPTMPSEANEAA
jgi:hypothetical protein